MTKRVWNPATRSCLVDLAGQRFGRLVAIERVSPVGARNAKWRCRCDCGGEAVSATPSLRKGMSRSCGCLQAETRVTSGRKSATHGHSRAGGRPSPTYSSWSAMWRRCTKPSHPAFADYGGRGILVCARWRSFEAFLADMGERPVGTTIDRIDNDRGYEPGNCRWATDIEQNTNRRSTRWITYDGRTQSLTAWCRERGLDKGTVCSRLRAGWGVDAALSTAPLSPFEKGMRAANAKARARAAARGETP